MTYFSSGSADIYNGLGLSAVDAAADGITEAMVTDAMNRATREIDEKTKTHFASGTTTPDYVAVTDEKQDGKGKYNRGYFTLKYPIPNIKTYTAGTVGISTGTVEVDSTAGYPASGVFGISNSKVTYTAKTGTAFTGCSGIAGTVAPDTTVYPYTIEISTDDQGSNPTWQVMSPDTEFDCDEESGRFYLYKNQVITSYYTTDVPPNYTPNRIKINYLYGWKPDSDGHVPHDIARCAVSIAIRDLLYTVVRRATIRGLNSFKPEMLNVDAQQIDETIKRYQNPLTSNT